MTFPFFAGYNRAWLELSFFKPWWPVHSQVPPTFLIFHSCVLLLWCIISCRVKNTNSALKFYIYEQLWYLRRYARLSGYLSHVALSICVGNRHLFPNQIQMKRSDTAASVWAERTRTWFIERKPKKSSRRRWNTREYFFN